MAIHQILTDSATSITDFKRNPAQLLNNIAKEGGAMAVLSRNQPLFYCVTPELFEYLQELAEDVELGKIATERLKTGKFTEVDINDL